MIDLIEQIVHPDLEKKVKVQDMIDLIEQIVHPDLEKKAKVQDIEVEKETNIENKERVKI